MCWPESFYAENKNSFKNKLKDFKNLDSRNYYHEMLFCLLTPQSNARKCWSAVEELKKLKNFDEEKVCDILRTRTRFHNNKTKYVLMSKKTFSEIEPLLSNKNIIDLRNTICKKVKGYGLKEAGHFLRNIGKSDNQIAILDRHILRNLKELKVIDDDKIKNNKHYLEIEQKFLRYSKQKNIPIDELDLLFWSKENGSVFK